MAHALTIVIADASQPRPSTTFGPSLLRITAGHSFVSSVDATRLLRVACRSLSGVATCSKQARHTIEGFDGNAAQLS